MGVHIAKYLWHGGGKQLREGFDLLRYQYRHDHASGLHRVPYHTAHDDKRGNEVELFHYTYNYDHTTSANFVLELVIA